MVSWADMFPPLGVVFPFSTRELFSIEVGATIDSAFDIQETSDLPWPDMMGLSQMDCIGPVGDHGRFEIWKGDFDQAADDIETVLIDSQPFDQPPLDQVGKATSFEPADGAVDCLDYLLLSKRPIELPPVNLSLAATDSIDGIVDRNFGFLDGLRHAGAVMPLGIGFIQLALVLHDGFQTVGTCLMHSN